LLSGLGPNGGGRSSFTDLKSVFAAFSTLPAKEPMLTAELNAWADYGRMRTQSNGKLAVAGFAWGGGRAWWFATQRKDLSAAFVFYDAAPAPEALAGVTAPVYGFYAMIDPRVTKSLSATMAAMAAASKRYEPVIYPGSEHMFVRLGEEPGNTNPANIEARTRALSRLQEILKCI
jgi:carboxymethylenebutenolidase